MTTAGLGEPSYDLILRQHETYAQTLKSLGLEIIPLDPLPGYPDAHFVEDVAVVTAEIAVITNPGAPPRKGERASIEPVLARYRKTERIDRPGTVDGGDVLIIGSHVFIGISERTNQEGAQQLGHILERHGMKWTTVSVREGLHLKSSVNHVGGDTILVTNSFAGHEAFRDYEEIVLDSEEDYAANTLLVNECLLTPKEFPKARQRLEARGRRIIELDVSEVRKMDGGLTCMSLRF